MRPPTPRWLLALLMCLVPLLALANFFAYHAPGAIASSMQAYFRLNEEDIAALYTIHSAPNVLLVFLGGVLIDRFGLVRTSLAFNLAMTVGMTLFAAAPRSNAMPWLMAGRFLLGVGGECLCVCAVGMLARWFKLSGLLSTSTGVYTAAVQVLGSAPAFVLLPYLLGDAGMNRHAHLTSDESAAAAAHGRAPETDEGNVRLCLWFTTGVCVLSLLANVAYALLDARYAWLYVAPLTEEDFEREMDRELARLELRSSASSSSSSAPNAGRRKDGEQYSVVSSTDLTHIDVAATNSNVLHGGEGGASNPASPGGDLESLDAAAAAGEGFSLRQLWSNSSGGSSAFSMWRPWVAVRGMPPLFWACLGMQTLLSPILYTFSVFSPLFFMERYAVTQEEAGVLTSLLYVAIILAPLAGWAIDRTGRRCVWQTVAAGGIPATFLVMHATAVSPYIAMVALGVCFAITESNGLAMIADVAPGGLLGTAYGILGCGTAIFLLFEPYVVGWLHVHTAHYGWSTVLFIIVSALGWLTSFVIYVYDLNHDRIMTESAASKAAEASIEMSEQNAAYPALEIVFDHDDEESEEEALFTIDDDTEERKT